MCHNYSFELVESTQVKLKALETDFKDHKSKFTTLTKSSNAVMQRVDEAKKGLADLTKVVTKLENKKWCPPSELGGSDLGQDIFYALVSESLTDGSVPSN